MSEWKIYTKTGDSGQTSLLGGRRVPKYHLRIEAYGTADELNAFIGFLRDHNIDDYYKKVLQQIQDRVFTAESILACDKGCQPEYLPELSDDDIGFLEEEIDKMNGELPALDKFIIPGGHSASSCAHVCRTVCRRAERIIIRLSEEEAVDERIIRYFNRLSDYFFVLARKLSSDGGVGDTHWSPGQ